MNKKNFILSGVIAFGTLTMLTQCNGNTSTNEVTPATGVSGMKIAYVEIDTLLTQYNLCKDMNEVMLKKQENIQATLNEKKSAIEKDIQEFQRNYENHVYTQERAQAVQQQILKKQQDYEALVAKLSNDFTAESNRVNMQLRDSINSFLKIYNQNKNYDLIISNTAYDNLLYANPAYNITKEIVDGLNARYVGKKE